MSKCESREISLAVMLLMVVAVFLICNILPFVNNFMESMTLVMNMELIDVSNFLVNVNSSVNCFIYCIFGTKFRKECYYVLGTALPCLITLPVKHHNNTTLHTNLTPNHHQVITSHQANQRHHSSSPYNTMKLIPQEIVASQATLV